MQITNNAHKKPGDALTVERAQKLVTFFDEELEILYSLLPQLTVKFSMVYFTDLVRVFKAEQPQQLWQHVGAKGILTGLLVSFHCDTLNITFTCSDLYASTRYRQVLSRIISEGGLYSAGLTTHFDKTFVTTLCQLLNSGSSSKYFKLSTNFRRCVGIWAILL
jgi:DNA integrity scanning protein DisA with diadenylate cyclase activity